jgi:hypothetical protein
MLEELEGKETVNGSTADEAVTINLVGADATLPAKARHLRREDSSAYSCTAP